MRLLVATNTANEAFDLLTKTIKSGKAQSVTKRRDGNEEWLARHEIFQLVASDPDLCLKSHEKGAVPRLLGIWSVQKPALEHALLPAPHAAAIPE